MAYGKHAAQFDNRGKNVARMLREAGYTLYAVKLNGDGSLPHPLHLKETLKPFE